MVDELILKCSVHNVSCGLLDTVIMGGLKWIWFLLTLQNMT